MIMTLKEKSFKGAVAKLKYFVAIFRKSAHSKHFLLQDTQKIKIW